MNSELGYKLSFIQQLLFFTRCLSHFFSPSALSNHSRMCGSSIEQITKVVMPNKYYKTKEGKIIEN